MSETSYSFHSTVTSNSKSISFQHSPIGDGVKRVFDIVAALLGMTVLSPFFIWVIWLIKHDSPGPVFYRGPRAGRNGKIFGILKFRTMYENPQSYQGPKITAHDDPRITSLGHWLRDTKLNELPQLWNVLIGDMSIVGPRPEDPEMAAIWPEAIREEILSVRPGITSPASVQYRNEETLLAHNQVLETYIDEIVPSKLRLDQLYVRNRSFWLDMDTIFWTLLIFVPRLGEYSPSQERLFWGPISQFGRRYLNWFMIDLLVSFFAMSLAVLFWRTQVVLNIGLARALAIALAFAIIYSLTNASLGVNRIAWSQAKASDIFDLIPAIILATFLALFVNQMMPENPLFEAEASLPSGTIILAAGLASAGFVIARYRSRLISGLATRWVNMRQDGLTAARERVLIIGGGESGQFAAWLLARQRPSNMLQVVGFIDDALFKQGERIQGIRVLGTRQDVPDIVRKHDVGAIIYAIHNISAEDRSEILGICAQTCVVNNVRLIVVPDILASFRQAVTANPEMSTNQTRSPKTPETQTKTVKEMPLSTKFWMTIPMEEIENHLSELEKALERGDLEQARSQVQSLQHIVQSERFS